MVVHDVTQRPRGDATEGQGELAVTTTAITSATKSPASMRRHWGGPLVGGFYLSMGGVHLGIVAAEPETYRHFADSGLFGFVRDAWHEIFMAYPDVFGLLLAAGETVLGVLLLLGGRAAFIGWAGAIAFHLLLMLFGFGIWVWCIPALALLIHLARRDTTARWPRITTVHLHSAGDPS